MDKSFTIVVCTYNGSRFLPYSLNALLELDSLDELVNEIIIVDNNSTDNTKEIVENYIKLNSLFKYHFEEKQGLSNARRHAVNVNTDWVIFVDDDNILKSNWLIELKKTVARNSKVGVINGAIIAHSIDTLSTEDSNCLKVMYHNLACTHLNEESIEGLRPNPSPVGAGLCVKVDALLVIEKEGWLNLTGRKGDSLASGEDTELCSRVLAQGYKYICNYNMRMYHIIPNSRLSPEYMSRLIIGLTNGRYDFISNNKIYILSRLFRCIKYLVIIMYMKSVYKKSNPGTEKYIKAKYSILSGKTFLNRTQNDSLFRRG